MEFTREEERILLQALYRFRGDVSGASQSEQNKYAMVEEVIAKIEKKSGPLAAERTRFDREMEESLSVLARGGAWPPAAGELDRGTPSPKVESKPRAGRSAASGGKGAAAKGRATAGKTAASSRAPGKKKAAAKAPAAKKAKLAGAPKSGGAGGARSKGVRAAKR